MPSLQRAPRVTSSPAKTPQLIYSRQTTSELLDDCSIATLMRYEQEGILKPFRLSNSPNGKVYYTAEDIHALIAKRRAAGIK